MRHTALAEPEFVGMEHELERLQQFLDAAAAGKGTTLFVFGEAGAGKTRLVKEFLKTVKEEQASIMKGFCLSKTPVPYFPFIEAFSTFYSDVSNKGISSAKRHLGILGWLKGNEMVETESLGIGAWLKGNETVRTGSIGISGWLKGPKQQEVARKQPTLSAEIRRNMTYVAVRRELDSIATNSPLVLFLDDVQWADSASLALLHYISRSISSSKILIIATVRFEEATRDPEGHLQPLAEALQLMKREDLFDEIRVPSLDKQQVEKLAELMVNGDIEPEFVEKLSKEGQGNPLFTVESLRMLIESGSLVLNEGTWCFIAKEFTIPTKVKDVILYRLNRLNAVQRRILNLGSVIGERFDPSLIGAVLSEDKLTILETLNTIASSTLLIVPADDVYKFSHSKFREVLYGEMTFPLRKEYHEKIAEKIESAAMEPSGLLVNDLAFHYVQAGNIEKAIQYSVAAGDDALTRFSNTEALKHFNYVLNTAPEKPTYKSVRLTAMEGIGDAHSAAGAYEEAIKAFERLSATAEQGGQVLRALRKAMTACFNKGDLPRALQLADEADKESAYDKLEYARIQMYRTRTNNFRGNLRFEEAFSELKSCLQIFEESNSPSDVADSLLEIGVLYVTDSRGRDAASFLQRAIELYGKLGNSWKQAEAYFWAGNAQFTFGSSEEALESWEKVIEIGEKIGEFNRMAWARLYSGLLYESTWELEEALRDSLKGIEYAEKTDSYYVTSMLYANSARICAKLGYSERLAEFREKFTKSFADAGRSSTKIARAVGVRTEAVLLASDGQWEKSHAKFRRCFELLTGPAAGIIHEAMARMDYAWVLEREGKTSEAKAQIEQAIRLYERLDSQTNVKRLVSMLGKIDKSI